MAKATLHISKQIFMELEISDTPVPPTPNFVDEVFIRDGLGQAVPTLELMLYDQKGTLTEDLALMEGKSVTLTLARNTERTLVRKFLVFGISTVNTHAGPRLRVVCILDIPLFIAKASSKAYKGTSSSVMQQIATECGLLYQGTQTSDDMTWLRVACTLNTFSEDVALHGYASETSCMSRIVTADNELRYMDLFEQLNKTAKATVLHNSVTEQVEGNKLLAREVRSGTQGGIMSYWMNYGYAQYEHNLSGKPEKILEVAAPITQGLPINTKVKSKVERSRIDYVGPDSGTAPTNGYNVHKYYRQAKYKNFRLLGLFNESITVLVEAYSDVQPFDPIKFEFNDQKAQSFVSNPRYTDKYLVANRVMAVKHGVRYYETLRLIRPTVGSATP